MQRDLKDGKVSRWAEEDRSSMNKSTDKHCQRWGLGTDSVWRAFVGKRQKLEMELASEFPDT